MNVCQFLDNWAWELEQGKLVPTGNVNQPIRETTAAQSNEETLPVASTSTGAVSRTANNGQTTNRTQNQYASCPACAARHFIQYCPFFVVGMWAND